MNNTFRRKEKTKIKIINSGAERWRGCAEEFWQNFATAAQNCKTKKLHDFSMLCKNNILELAAMGGGGQNAFVFVYES